jgi:hypothetical protein
MELGPNVGRRLAGFLTASRVLLSIGLAGLGAVFGAESLPAAIPLIILCWLIDLIDGPLARQVRGSPVSWVGQHDAGANQAIALGTTAYLLFSDYLNPWLGTTLMLALLLVWMLHPNQLAWPFYIAPHIILGVATFQQAPLIGWLLLGYLLAPLAVRWSRTKGQFLVDAWQKLGVRLARSNPRGRGPEQLAKRASLSSREWVDGCKKLEAGR